MNIARNKAADWEQFQFCAIPMQVARVSTFSIDILNIYAFSAFIFIATIGWRILHSRALYTVASQKASVLHQ